MAVVVTRSTMCLTVWVDWEELQQQFKASTSSKGLLTVGSGRCASVCVVAELMDVHATLGIRVMAGNVPCDSGRGRLVGLLKGDCAGNLRVASNKCNYSKLMPSVGGSSE
jgi:hypothetical protein